MQISENLKTELLNEFKSENILKKLIDEKKYYYFNDFNINKLFKIFSMNSQKIFSETNSKKHLNKIQDIIKSNFINFKTTNYVNLILNPTFKIQVYENRKKAFENIKNIEFSNSEVLKIKEIIESIELLKTKISFSNRLISFEKSICEQLYENFKIHIEFSSKKEIEEIMQYEDLSDVVIISDEDLYTQIPTFSLKEFKKIIIGNLIKTNSKQIFSLLNLYQICSKYHKIIFESYKNIFNINLNINLNVEKLIEILNKNDENNLAEITTKTLRLDEEVAQINKELKEIISKKQLSLAGDELLEILNSGGVEDLQKKFQKDIDIIVLEKEKELIKYYKDRGIVLDCFFSKISYPLNLDEDIKDKIFKDIEFKNSEIQIKVFESLGEFDLKSIKNLWDFSFYFDFIFGISKFNKKFKLNYPIIENEISLINGRNIYIENPKPINYGISTNQFNLKSEKVAILTGANSGGKTTLLEMFLQSQILTSLGLGIAAENKSRIRLNENVIYLKKFSGTVGAGAFEQTIRNLIEIISTNEKKLLLIDEFEAITEPGAAAKILINFLEEITKMDTFCIGVSHLGVEIKDFIETNKILDIRIDGICATGLDKNGNLITNHQPQFYELGKSTPELILKRILQDTKFWNEKSENSKKLIKKIIG